MGGPDGQYQLVWTLLHQDWDAHGRMGRRVFDLAALNKKLESSIIFHGSDEWSRVPKHYITVSFQQYTFDPRLHLFTSHLYIHLPGPSHQDLLSSEYVPPHFCVKGAHIKWFDDLLFRMETHDLYPARSHRNTCICMYTCTTEKGQLSDTFRSDSKARAGKTVKDIILPCSSIGLCKCRDGILSFIDNEINLHS